MNFFQQLADLNLVGDLKLVIKPGQSMIVSVLLDNEACGDNARKIIPPLALKGTAAELDAVFFTTIGADLQTTSGLQVDMEAYRKGQEAAKTASAMEKDKAEKEKQRQDAKKKAYDEAIKKVNELLAEKKYKEALTKLPKSADYPQQAEAIKARHSEIVKLLTGTTSLFDQTDDEAVNNPEAPTSLISDQDDEDDNPAQPEEEDREADGDDD